MTQWFLQRSESGVQTEVGPLRPHEVLAMVRRGEIEPQTLLRKDDSAWFAAKEVGGLFEAAVRQETQYFCPSCNRRISKPPITCPNCLRDLGRGEARVVQPQKMAATIGEPANAPNNDESHQSVQNWLLKKVARRKSK